MNLRTSHLALALCIVGLLCAAAYLTRGITPAWSDCAAISEGGFRHDGQFPGAPFAEAHGVRSWGSWSGSDANTGSLKIGPFPAPATLSFGAGGYATSTGNEVYLQHHATVARVPVPVQDIGERWNRIDFVVPPAWVGQQVSLVAVDQSTAHRGWLALTEPIQQSHFGSAYNRLLLSLAAWMANGVWLGLLWIATHHWLARRDWIEPHWTPLVAAGGVAAAGYFAFWIYFAHPVAGKIFSVSLPLLAVVAIRRPKHRAAPATDGELVNVATLLAVIGLLYVALLHFFPSEREFYNLAANRFRTGLPGDNTLPHNAAEQLYAGRPLRQPAADWQSSDRPPLQSGWLLLTAPATSALQLDPRTGSGTAAIWFQLLWIPAAYGLLRTLQLPRSRARAWVAALAFTGFFLQQTVFSWPKLSAAAFAVGAFALWVLPVGRVRRQSAYLIGAALMALAWLSHGGVAFSCLALAPWIAWRALRGEWRQCGLAAITFLAFATPWICYQKFYDPPGDRLLKWHLGGQIAKDPRGTWETIRTAYARLSTRHIVAAKLNNLQLQIAGDWPSLFNFNPARSHLRRETEFFNTARALTGWLLGFLLLPLALGRGPSRAWVAATARSQIALAMWTAGTIMIWCLLMFLNLSAVIHLGSYATLLVLFVLLSLWVESAGAAALPLLLLFQIPSFATTWAVSNSAVNGDFNALAVTLALGATAILGVFAFSKPDPDSIAAYQGQLGW